MAKDKGTPILITFPPDELAALDKTKGILPRTLHVRILIREALQHRSKSNGTARSIEQPANQQN